MVKVLEPNWKKSNMYILFKCFLRHSMMKLTFKREIDKFNYVSIIYLFKRCNIIWTMNFVFNWRKYDHSNDKKVLIYNILLYIYNTHNTILLLKYICKLL